MAHSHAEVSSPENMELPQRSRNARAQARHRAKRKAYIEKVGPIALYTFNVDHP